MRNPDEFDAFYKDARDRLLLQTYALTGDLAASRAAVRDSFVVAWHHWRKVSQLEDPEAWARPHAWAHAQRRHTARLWHRDKGLDPDIRATLSALGKLPMVQRKALLLTQLASVSMGEMARAVGLPRSEAERELQTAVAQFALHRDIATTTIPTLFQPLREHLASVRWPRPTIIRRAGAARRRTHTSIGAVAAVAALLVTGSLVTDLAGLRPTLAREALSADGPRHRPPTVPAPEPEALPEDALLTAEQVAEHVPGRRWTVSDTTDNTAGDGLVLPCQRDRYADPRGAAALVRTFATTPRPRRPAVSAIQATEVSRSTKAARRTYESTLEWYAGCLEERVQLLAARRIDRVGDEAMLLVLRSWDRPVTTRVVAVARTGDLTTTTMSSVADDGRPDYAGAARLVAAAVDGLCTLPDAGTCADRPRLESVPPPPIGEVPGMLSELDLPPVTRVDRPWVGTTPRKALVNVAGTRCDEADFSADPMTNNLTRSFVIPKAKLPAQFGITETVGSLPVRRARAFVARIRTRMSGCPDKELGTDVVRVAQLATPARDLTVWHVTTEITDTATVEYLMGIVRAGTSLAQVGFVPDPKVEMAPGAFIGLVERALERVSMLPPPKG